MDKIFLDSNIILDYLTNRPPFSIDAAILFELANQQKLTIFVSSLSINNINYFVSRLESKSKALKVIHQLMPLVEILPVGKSTVEKSLHSKFKDFEDGLQNFCAEEGGLTTIITRDAKDFAKSKLSIQTPHEFLAAFK